jgi:hypothetical protein
VLPLCVELTAGGGLYLLITPHRNGGRRHSLRLGWLREISLVSSGSSSWIGYAFAALPCSRGASVLGYRSKSAAHGDTVMPTRTELGICGYIEHELMT